MGIGEIWQFCRLQADGFLPDASRAVNLVKSLMGAGTSLCDHPLGIADFLKLVIEALEAAGVEYLIGGAIADWA